jgi:hypothetical protein
MPRPTRLLRLLIVTLLPVLLVSAVLAPPVSAHEEREAGFPDGTGTRPVFAGWDNPDRRVVCKPGSVEAVAAMPGGR